MRLQILSILTLLGALNASASVISVAESIAGGPFGTPFVIHDGGGAPLSHGETDNVYQLPFATQDGNYTGALTLHTGNDCGNCPIIAGGLSTTSVNGIAGALLIDIVESYQFDSVITTFLASESIRALFAEGLNPNTNLTFYLIYNGSQLAPLTGTASSREYFGADSQLIELNSDRGRVEAKLIVKFAGGESERGVSVSAPASREASLASIPEPGTFLLTGLLLFPVAIRRLRSR